MTYLTSTHLSTQSIFLKTDLDEAARVLSRIRQALSELDPETREHCERVAEQSRAFGEFLQLSQLEIHALMWGGYLHDIGKAAIPSAILLKPGKLTPAERLVMQQHVVIGEQLGLSLLPMQQVLAIIRHHHECWNGCGYPDRLRQDEIPFLARVAQLVDVYDALTYRRAYKPPVSHRETLKMLAEDTANGWYDPTLMEQFLQFQANR